MALPFHHAAGEGVRPKFTDGHRWARPYKPALETDITKTWEAARKKLEAGQS
jgi:hypothetical protein